MILVEENIGSRFIEILTSYTNPFFLILFFAVVIVFIMFFFSRYVLKPIEEKHIREKQEIEFKNSKLMAMFAELDPDPVLRVDEDGKVVFFNEAAARLLNIEANTLIPGNIFKITAAEVGRIIGEGINHSFPYEHKGIHYNVLITGITDLGIAQFYLRDISAIKNLEIKLKQLSSHLQNQLDEERFRIAHELHDGIVQELYLVQIGLGKMEDDLDFKAHQSLQSVRLQLKNVSDELRRIIYDLKPKILDEMGLEPALKTLCNNIIKEKGITGSVEIIGYGERLDKKLEIYFYRVIQEALSNVVRHSGATEFNVFVIKDDRSIKAIVSDNGCGIREEAQQKPRSGFGLLNMKERTEGLGGVFKVDSSENEGTVLIVEIPLTGSFE